MNKQVIGELAIMSVTICRPFITLRNGKVLFASAIGKRAFCFEVDEVVSKKAKDSPKDESAA